MKITNTSTIPDAIVRACVLFAAKELEMTDYVYRTEVVHSKFPLAGRCYGKRIRIRIGANSHYPHVRRYPGLKTSPIFNLADNIEGLVKVAAHEFQHSRQGKYGAKWHSEVEADQVALRVLTVFREHREEIVGRVQERMERQTAIAAERAEKAKADAPAQKLEKLREQVAKWTTKVKRANTILKKWQRRLRRAEKATP